MPACLTDPAPVAVPPPAAGVCTRRPGLWLSSSVLERRAAAAICREVCPQLEHCLRYAAQAQPEAGVWAGVDCTVSPLHPRSPFAVEAPHG